MTLIPALHPIHPKQQSPTTTAGLCSNLCNLCNLCPRISSYLRTALRAELRPLRIRAAAGAFRRSRRALDLLTAVGAELRAAARRAALGATIGHGLNHLRAAFGAELRAGLG